MMFPPECVILVGLPNTFQTLGPLLRTVSIPMVPNSTATGFRHSGDLPRIFCSLFQMLAVFRFLQSAPRVFALFLTEGFGMKAKSFRQSPFLPESGNGSRAIRKMLLNVMVQCLSDKPTGRIFRSQANDSVGASNSFYLLRVSNTSLLGSLVSKELQRLRPAVPFPSIFPASPSWRHVFVVRFASLFKANLVTTVQTISLGVTLGGTCATAPLTCFGPAGQVLVSSATERHGFFLAFADAFAALRAIAFRCAEVSFLALALPPRLPISCRYLDMSLGVIG